jgi:hypothetical protein
VTDPQPPQSKPDLLAALDKAARATGSAARAAGEAALAAGEAALAATMSPSDAISAARITASSVVRVADTAARTAVDAVGDAATRTVTGNAPSSRSSLRARGDALLNRSSRTRDPMLSEHPAFEHILDDLAPDEARILRFLAVAGPQPSIDVRTRTPLLVGSQRLAAGISFIADMAGCASPDRSHEYLGNLARLGLIRFSAEPVDDFRRYYLLDAHPDTVAAMHRVKRTIAVYRSIYLSVFGEQFCAECFSVEGYDAGGWAKHDPGDRYWGKGPRLS